MKTRFSIIVVGTGLAGASASASLAEMSYNVKTFCIQDSLRRAHSIAAQGRPEATQRMLTLLKAMENCGFGNCTNHCVCENVCLQEVSVSHIARFNREFLKSALCAKSDR